MTRTAVLSESDRRRPSRERLLVVDDDLEVRRLVVRLLESEGYQVTQASTRSEVMAELASARPDLILLDVMLAEDDGFDVLTAVRRNHDVPVIFLTAKMAENDRVLGLRLGADDYVVKPFSGSELVARVSSVLRRTGHVADGPAVLKFGELSIDTSSREISVGDHVVETTMKEFDLLAFLASSPRQVFSREQLLDHVWGSSPTWQDDGTVTEHIRRIRQKLGCGRAANSWIRTVRGVGYRFEP